MERAGPPEFPEELLLRVETPMPGLVHLFARSMGGRVYLPVRLYLYGDEAAEVAACEEPRWQAWLMEQSPPSTEPG